ncbi:MAG: lipopolysaccharide transport periplasmic protein LptA [Deltaproteobacteria bacterium]|nr:lipopolysaccharide transport periplasmic protein LptA [Deltaproteobacteria bacterium]
MQDAPRPVAASTKAASPDNLLGALSFTAGREPISVSANGLEFDYRGRVLTYKGNVVATQGDMKLQTDTLTITLAEGGENQLREVVAVGNVRLSKGSRTATSGRAVFDQVKHTVVLTENPILQDGGNQVTGDRVTVYLDQERSVVDGGNGKVRALFAPPKKDEGAPANPSATPPIP